MSYLKRLTNAALGRLQAFRMYGGIGMSASSLHRESTDSLIHVHLSPGSTCGLVAYTCTLHIHVLAQQYTYFLYGTYSIF